MEKEMAINGSWTIITWEAQQKHPPTHATPSIQETYINHHTTKDWQRLHRVLPIMDTLTRMRIHGMHLWQPPCDTKTPPAGMQNPQHSMQTTEDIPRTIPSHLANGDARDKRTSGQDALSPKHRDRDKIMADRP
jgi:hypothetical protein